MITADMKDITNIMRENMIRFLLVILSVLCMSCAVRVVQPETWVAYEVTMVDERYAVDPGTYLAITLPVNLNSGVREVSISGSFESGGDIDVYVLDSYNFSKYESGKPFSYIYYSDRTNMDSFAISIDFSDNYILVLDNSFAVYTGKYVDVTVYKNYEQLQ